jgi:DNA repair exonuclease SbcCD ATPase subunit
MKTHNQNHFAVTCSSRLIRLSSIGLTIICCLAFKISLSQTLDVSTSGTTYKSPDPESIPTPEALKGAIVTAELAGQSLNADAEAQKAQSKNAESELDKVRTMRTDYIAGLNSYTKNGYDPYMADLNSYTPNVARYGEILARHNAATAASNALAPENRSAATVASLNSEKAELDSWKAKLDTWKSNLDAAKDKLDIERNKLLDQKHQFEAAYASAMISLRASQLKLKGKFNYTGTSMAGYFGSPVYKGSIEDLNTNLERLKHLSDAPWDGRN